MPEDHDPAPASAPLGGVGAMSYGDYLRLDRLLDAQAPLTAAHDEVLFVIQHQVSELWMRLAIHEVAAARRLVAEDDLAPAMKGLARASRIFEQLIGAWDVLRTLTPSDYLRFRDRLGQSSGFQSWQYRLIEFMLGHRDEAALRPHAHDARVTALLEAELAVPSLYDEAVRLLARRGLAVPPAALGRDPRGPRAFDEGVMAAWREVYAAPEAHWPLYEMAEKLVDLEDYVRRWRFNHVTTVERVIGLKRGTGGTAGVPYLQRVLEVELFPELWRVRTAL